MVEILFLVSFAMTLLITGVNKKGLVLSVIVGVVVMMIAGTLSVLFKLLPWVLFISLVIWIVKSENQKAKRCREFCLDYVARVRNKKS